MPVTARLIFAAGIACASLHPACAEEIRFLRDVAPVLLQRCSGCHGPLKAEGGYRAHTYQRLLAAGDSGAPAIVPGKPEESELFVRITDAAPETRMPQEDDPLARAEIALIRDWIGQGAPFDGVDPALPLAQQLPPRTHPPPPVAYPRPVSVQALRFTPDGRRIVVGGHHEATLWDAETGELIDRWTGLPQRIHALAFLSGGERLLVGGGSPGEYGELCEVDPSTGARSRVFGTFSDVVLSAAVSPDGRRVLATSADRSVRCYAVDDGRMLWESALHADWATTGAFSADGRFVVTGSRDGSVKALEAETGALYTTYKGHQRNLGPQTGRHAVYALIFAGEGSQAFSAGEGQSVRIWEPEKAQAEDGSAADMEIRFFKPGHTVYIMHESREPVFGLALADGRLFTAGGDGFVREFDVATQKKIRDYRGQRDWLFSIDVHSGARRVAAGAHDGRICVWDTESGEQKARFLAVPGRSRP